MSDNLGLREIFNNIPDNIEIDKSAIEDYEVNYQCAKSQKAKDRIVRDIKINIFTNLIEELANELFGSSIDYSFHEKRLNIYAYPD